MSEVSRSGSPSSAIATAAGQLQSAVTTAIFNFSDQTPTPALSPTGGTYNAAQQVSISDTDKNAKIYYTLDGSTPSASSTLYSGPINVAISDERSKAFVGIHPQLRQMPPIFSRSTTAVFKPSCAARMAAT